MRESSFGALPANLSRIDRYRLAATPPRRRERDVYLSAMGPSPKAMDACTQQTKPRYLRRARWKLPSA
jgi:hypothetical protein